MPSVLIITPDSPTSSVLGEQLRHVMEAGNRRIIDGYPDPAEMASLLHVYTPDIVFVHCLDFRRALTCIASVQASGVGTPIVAVGCPPEADKIMTVIRTGAMEVMPLPIQNSEIPDVRANIARLLQKYRPNYTDAAQIHCFIPARAGVGTSVLAVNAAIAAATLTQKRVLLCDLDPSLGMASFLMKAPEWSSVHGVLGNVDRIDEEIWKRFVYTRNGVDVLGSGPLESGGMRVAEVQQLFRFVSRLYDYVIVDFSGALEPFCVDVMHWARRVYLVTTPEVPSLHFGRYRAEALRKAGLQDRISVLLNRDSRNALSREEIEQLLQCKVTFTFSNDYKRVNEAALRGTPVDTDSTLGMQLKEFAAALTDTPLPATAGKRRGLRDLLMPSRAMATPAAG